MVQHEKKISDHDVCQPKQKTRLLNNFLQGLIKIIVVCALLVAVVQTVFYFFAFPLFKSKLQDDFKKRTDNLYSLDFSDVKFDLLKRSIYLSDFVLTPDTAVYVNLKSNINYSKAIYNVSVKQFIVDHIKLSDIFSGNKLSVRNIILNNPSVSIAGRPSEDNQGKYDAIHKDLYPIIKTYFNELSVCKIIVNDGYFDFFSDVKDVHQKALVGKIDITLFSLKVDEKIYKTNKKLFYADSILLKSNNYYILLADSVHTLTADKIIVRTSDSLVCAYDVKLKYDKNVNPNHFDKNLFDVSFDTLQLKGLDLSSAYFTKKVKASVVKVANPNIVFIRSGKKNHHKSLDNFSPQTDLYPLIKGSLQSLEVDTFKFMSASVKIYKNSLRKYPDYKVEKLDFVSEQFLLDSTAFLNHYKILYSKDLEIYFHNFEMRLPDHRHILTATSLNLSTKNKLLDARQIRVFLPHSFLKDTIDTLHSRVNVAIPHMYLNNIDFHTAFNTGNYRIGTLCVVNSKSNFNFFSDTLSVKVDKSKLWTQISNEYFNILSINKISFQNCLLDYDFYGNADYNNLFLSGCLTLNINRYFMSQRKYGEAERPFSMENVDFVLTDFTFKPKHSVQVLKADKILANSSERILKLRNIVYTAPFDTSTLSNLKAIHKKTSLQIGLKHADFIDIDIRSAFLHNKLDVKTVFLSSPSIYIRNYKNLQFDSYPDVETTDSSERFEPRLVINNDSVYIAEPFMPDDSSVALINTSSLLRDSVMANSSMLDSLIFTLIPSKISLIKMDSLSVDSGFLRYEIYGSDFKEVQFAQTDFNFVCDKFNFCRDSVPVEENFMFAKNYDLNFKNFKYKLPDGIHLLRCGAVHLSTYDNDVNIKQLWLQDDFDFDIVSPRRYFNAYCPEISLKGADFKSFAHTCRFIADTLNLNNSVFVVVNNPDFDSIKVSLQTNKQKSFLNDNFKSLNVNYVNGKGSKFSIVNNKQDIDNRLLYVDFDFCAQHFSVDSNNISKKGNLFAFENPYAKFSKFNFLSSGGVELRSENAILLNDTFNIKRIFVSDNNNDEMSEKHRFECFIPEVSVYSPDVESMIFSKKIKLDKMFIRKPEIEINIPDKASGGSVSEFKFNKINSLFANSVISYGIKLIVNKNDKNILKLNNLDFKITHLNTDSAYNKLIPAEDVTAGIDNFGFYLKDSLYFVSANRIEFSPDKSRIIIKGIDFRPSVERYDFYKQFERRKSAPYISCDKLTADRFDVIRFIKYKELNVGKLNIEGASFHSFVNKNVAYDTAVHKPNLHAFIRKIPIITTIDTINFSNSYIGVEQLTPEASLPGVLSLNKVNGHVYNLTNNPDRISENNVMMFGGYAKLMDKTDFRAAFRYVLDSPDDEFVCNAHFDSLYLPALNPFLGKTLFAQINEGYLKSADISFLADNKTSIGECKFNYHGLKLAVNKRDSLQQKKRGLISFAANRIIRTDNPKHKYSSVKPGVISTEPDLYKSFTSYWIKSIISGAKATVGFESREQKSKRKILSKVRNIVDLKSRKENKRKRKQRLEYERQLELFQQSSILSDIDAENNKMQK